MLCRFLSRSLFFFLFLSLFCLSLSLSPFFDSGCQRRVLWKWPHWGFFAITRDEVRSCTDFMYLHMQRLYCTYICRACKVHASSVQSRCTHSYSRTLSRHANGQRLGREHDDRFVLRAQASEPAHVSREYYASLASTCMVWSLSESREWHLCIPRAGACRMQQFRRGNFWSSSSTWGFCAHDFSLSLSHSLCLSFSLSHSLSLVLLPFLSHRNRRLHASDCLCEQGNYSYGRTTRHQLQCSSSISISSSHRHAGTYGQPHTHIHTNHWVIMKITWARGCKGQHTARTQKQPKSPPARHSSQIARFRRFPDCNTDLTLYRRDTPTYTLSLTHTGTHALAHIHTRVENCYRWVRRERCSTAIKCQIL